MELRHLRYFVAVAEELHFGRAAKRLSITQPPLSFNIQSLEEHLGTRLLDRDSRSVSLTVAGEAFLAEARRVLAQAQHAEEVTRAVASGRLGSLQLGFTSSMLYRGVPEILAGFVDQSPSVDYDLIDMPLSEQVESLKQYRVHAAFTPALSVPRGLAGHRLYDDEFACCLHTAHPLASRRRIRLNALVDEPFVLFARHTTPSGHEHVLSMCAAAGFLPKTRFYVKQWLTAVALVSRGFGVALVPSSISAAGVKDVCFITLDDPRRQISSYLIWNPENVTPTLARLIEYCRIL
ncbi:MAG: LysR substrate-binding domain-containing protein [Burkholderiaceae bacterium]